MTTILLQKDYTIIGTSTKHPERVIIEMDKNVLDRITKRKRILHEASLRDYIVSGEIDNTFSISGSFGNVDDLIESMK